MADLKLLRGARAPLFDRFGDEDGEGGGAFLPWSPSRRNRPALEQSIGAELERLLNTRCAASLAQLAGRKRTVIDYGLPDYATLHTADIGHRRQLATLLRDTITAFEPRLSDVQVDVELDMNSRHGLTAAISGNIRVAERLEPVSFKVAVKEEA